MKKVIYSIGAILMSVLLLCSCSAQSKSSSATPKPTEGSSVSVTAAPSKSEDGPVITVKSPMTLSNNGMFPISGRHENLMLKMIMGSYAEDWNPGAIMGTIWQGSFIIEVTDEYGKTIAKTDIAPFYNEPLVFTSCGFALEFDDYNDDGDVDFTVGQYASSNGREYKLFTLRKDGKVEELPIKDYPVLFISNSTGYYSTKLTKVDKTTFKKEYYDNSVSKNFEDYFHWENGQFLHIKHQELK